jgi:hypothetical protein
MTTAIVLAGLAFVTFLFVALLVIDTFYMREGWWP